MNGNSSLKTVVLCTLSMATGFAIGYFAAKHHLEQHYVDLANEEIKDAKEYYESVADEKTASVPDGRERIFYNTLMTYQQGGDTQVTEEQQVQETAREVLQTIWREDKDMEELTAISTPSPNLPYVVPVHVFMANEMGFSQVTLTFYEGDHILADDQDDPVEDVESTVGMRNLVFGHLSNDENVVYVRNERLTLDFEVCRSYGSFAKEVHDIDPQQVT